MTATVKVTNISAKVTEKDIYDFFAFSGEIKYIHIGKEPEENKQFAYVTFHEERALDTALLLTDAVMADSHVTVEPAVGYVPQNMATSMPPPPVPNQSNPDKVSRAENVISSMLAKGYILGIDTMSKAKAFDEKHQLTQSASLRASVTASNLDRRMGGISSKITAGATTVNQSVQAFDRKYQLSEKTKGALTVAEQKINEAASALMRFQTVAKGANWLSNAFSKVAKVAEDVTVQTKEKVQKTEMERGITRPSDHVTMDSPVRTSNGLNSDPSFEPPSLASKQSISPSVDSIPDKLTNYPEIQTDANKNNI